MSTDDAVLTITGGEAIARMLAKFDVGPIFGMGGFQLLPFYDAAGRLGLLHHLVNDERAGVFMADSYAKMSGKVGIVDATLGPGATNLVTGLVEALNAGTPLVAIIGDTHRDYSGKNMTQESRQADILRPAAKELITIPTPQRIPELVRRAFTIATSGRPGPVVLNVPEDVSHGICSFDNRQFYADPVYRRVPALRIRPDRSSLQTAAEMICRASRPLLVAGGGAHISDAGSVLTTFVETLNIPVAHTMTGKGAIACTNSLNAGPFGRYDRFANELVASADLLIAVGCKLGEIATKRYTVAPDNGRVIQIDIVAEEIGRTLHPDLGLWGDVRETISGLLDAIGGRGPILRAQLAPYAKEVAELMTAWRESISDRLTTDETPISMARLMNEINLLLPA